MSTLTETDRFDLGTLEVNHADARYGVAPGRSSRQRYQREDFDIKGKISPLLYIGGILQALVSPLDLGGALHARRADLADPGSAHRTRDQAGLTQKQAVVGCG